MASAPCASEPGDVRLSLPASNAIVRVVVAGGVTTWGQAPRRPGR